MFLNMQLYLHGVQVNLPLQDSLDYRSKYKTEDSHIDCMTLYFNMLDHLPQHTALSIMTASLPSFSSQIPPTL